MSIRAHVEGCPTSLSVPVDLCSCGGRDFTPDPPCASCASLRSELADLRDWKESALQSLVKWHALGIALIPLVQMRLGEDTAPCLTERIPAEIARLRSELERVTARLRGMEDALSGQPYELPYPNRFTEATAAKESQLNFAWSVGYASVGDAPAWKCIIDRADRTAERCDKAEAALASLQAAQQHGRAEAIARLAHRDQKDKVTGEPYIQHVERVVASVDGDDAKAVAWLHDVVEDWTEVFGNDAEDRLLAFGFSAPVVEAVLRLTRGYYVPRAAERYQDYVASLADNALARAVKIADIRDHLHPNCPASLRPRYEIALASLLPAPPTEGK
jgi:hypothetical protein